MSSDKVVSLAELPAVLKMLRAAGKRIVATNGCFDLLHVGHVRYLSAARAFGDILVVGLNGDDSVHQLKGSGRPINKALDRAEVLAALEVVDRVAIFPERRATHFIEAVRPDVYVKGGDYTVDTLDPEERALLKKIGARIEIVPLVKNYSTSGLLKRLNRPVT